MNSKEERFMVFDANGNTLTQPKTLAKADFIAQAKSLELQVTTFVAEIKYKYEIEITNEKRSI